MENLLAYLKLPTKILAGVGLAAAAILFLPTTWVAVLGLAQLRTLYPAPLGLAVLVPAALLIIEGIVFVSGWLRTRVCRKPFEAYTMDEFFGMRWRWKWNRERGFVVDPRAFCPSCDLQLDGVQLMYGLMGAQDIPSGEFRYHCTDCGKTDIKIKTPNTLELARKAGELAEREARKRGLLKE